MRFEPYYTSKIKQPLLISYNNPIRAGKLKQAMMQELII